MNLIMSTDSYKPSHWLQYPPKTEYIYSYLEARGGVLPETLFYSLSAILKKYFKPITYGDIQEAKEFFKIHLGREDLFNEQGWLQILEEFDGCLPLRIRAVPEGMVVPTGNVLMTIENTDSRFYWLTNYVETILSQVWYGTTVATLSYECRQTILEHLKKSGTPETIDFKLHDFGFRGASSVETAGIGGSAHLINFKGTDTLAAFDVIKKYYSNEGDPYIVGFSIPAAEHSTITSWGKEREALAYKNMLNQFGDGIVAVVSDSYNIFDACQNIWGGELKEDVQAMRGSLVVRPDSGPPAETTLKVLEILGDKFGYTWNAKGFKVLNNRLSVIWGDGIDFDGVERILNTIEDSKWSADNVSFGMGGGLLQKVDRDTLSFALKCSWAQIDGQEVNVQKTPVTSIKKVSKTGRLKLINDNGLKTVNQIHDGVDLLVDYFLNGKQLYAPTFSEIRKRALTNESTAS